MTITVPSAEKRVCVTGGNGFMGSWVVRTLLDSGYTVTVTFQPGTDPSHLLAFPGADDGRLRLREADLLEAAAIAGAVDGCREGVFHVASPCSLEDPPDPERELLLPAVVGTLNVLEAARAAGSRRVVLTSSISAMVPNPRWATDRPGRPVDEECWTDLDYCKSRQKWYPVSKTMAEKRAWEFAETYGLDIVAINPSACLGPLLQPGLNASSAVLQQLLQGIMEALCSKVMAWEEERGAEFTYDGVRLLSMLEEYSFVRQEKEQERRRQRDQKKLQSQFLAEQEALFGSKPSPSKPQCLKKAPRSSSVASRRLSLGPAALQSMKPDFPKATASAKRGNEFTFVSPAKKGVTDAGIPLKLPSTNSDYLNSFHFEPPRKSFGAQQSETPRKPFAPLCPANNLASAPSPFIHGMVREDENQPMPVAATTPRTPATVTKPMQVANTPAAIARPLDEKEYSFEERRLAVYQRR